MLARLGQPAESAIQQAGDLDVVQQAVQPATATSSCSWQLPGQPPSHHSRSPWMVEMARPWAVWLCRSAS
jgi:hypothetical protein